MANIQQSINQALATGVAIAGITGATEQLKQGRSAKIAEKAIGQVVQAEQEHQKAVPGAQLKETQSGILEGLEERARVTKEAFRTTPTMTNRTRMDNAQRAYEMAYANRKDKDFFEGFVNAYGTNPNMDSIGAVTAGLNASAKKQLLQQQKQAIKEKVNGKE